MQPISDELCGSSSYHVTTAYLLVIEPNQEQSCQTMKLKRAITYGNGTSLCVRALQQLRICPRNSSRVEREGPSHVWACRAASRLASKIRHSERRFQRVREPRCVGPLWRLLWAHDSLRRRRQVKALVRPRAYCQPVLFPARAYRLTSDEHRSRRLLV